MLTPSSSTQRPFVVPSPAAADGDAADRIAAGMPATDPVAPGGVDPAAPGGVDPVAPTATPAVSGVRGFFGEVLRGIGAGFAAVTGANAVTTDAALNHPRQTVLAATQLLKDSTTGVPRLGTATSVLHTAAGFGVVAATATMTGGMRAPGSAVLGLTRRVAEAVDGRQVAKAPAFGPLGALGMK